MNYQCPRCGSVLKENDRCCLKCGAPNYYNASNEQYLKKYGNKKEYKKATDFGFKKRNQRRQKMMVILIMFLIILIIAIVTWIFLKK